MLRVSDLTAVVVSCFLSGCMVGPSANVIGRNLNVESRNEVLKRRFLDELVDENHSFLRDQVSKTTRGTEIGVYDDAGIRYCGTVLEANAEVVVLMNCMSREIVKTPDGQQQVKTSHVPFQEVQVSRITHFVEVASPSPDFPATDEDLEPEDVRLETMISQSGRRYSWGQPSVAADQVQD